MYFLTLIAKNLFRRKERSILTIIGMAIAVCAVITMRGVAYNFDSAFNRNFQERGIGIVVMEYGKVDQISSDLDENLAKKFLEIDGVKEVHMGLNEMIEVKKKGSSSISGLMIGWPSGGPQFDDVSILKGRILKPDDDDHLVMIGKTLAEDLGVTPGDTVEMQGEEFEVVGIFESFHHFESGGVLMNLTALQVLMFSEGMVTGFGIVLDETEDTRALAKEVSDKINAIKEDTRGERVRLSAKPTEEYVDSFIPLQLASAMTLMTSLLALIFATIFLLTTMIMSVLERVKEIGILRAVGWRKHRVIQLILGESVMLAIMGAILGALVAYPVIWGMTEVPGIRGFIGDELPFVVVLQGLGMAIVMGIIGGLGPALRASRMPPTEALRHE